jgi:serine phosphatase RsbU (regulator of sigma subunit)
MLYGILDTAAGDFVFARAGHEPPLFLPARAELPELMATEGLAIGMVPSPLFRRRIENSRLHLEPGEGILLISDGIPDACDERGVRFGKERLRDALVGYRAAGAVRALMEALAHFTGGSARNDDITAVAFGRDGERPEAPGATV